MLLNLSRGALTVVLMFCVVGFGSSFSADSSSTGAFALNVLHTMQNDMAGVCAAAAVSGGIGFVLTRFQKTPCIF